MLNNIEFSNFISGVQFSLLAQSLLSVGITQPRTLILMLYLSIILGFTNIFMKNVTFAQSMIPEHTIDLSQEFQTSETNTETNEPETKGDNNMDE